MKNQGRQSTGRAFSFGENWQDFVDKSLTPERIDIAKRHMIKFLGRTDLQGIYFLDAGCGSGLSSLAAYQLGAEKIVSFDVDPHSVKATEALKEMAGNPSNWTVLSGTILDKAFTRSLGNADIVYSWGVLHHTGEMWAALENATRLLADTGMLYISLYVTTARSEYWRRVKKLYNSTSTAGKRMMELWYIVWYTFIRQLLVFRNPVRHILEYRQRRGMSYLHDIRDWLGGYPYEHAKIEEVLSFARKHRHLELVNIDTSQSTIEYLFRKGSSLKDESIAGSEYS